MTRTLIQKAGIKSPVMQVIIEAVILFGLIITTLVTANTANTRSEVACQQVNNVEKNFGEKIEKIDKNVEKLLDMHMKK